MDYTLKFASEAEATLVLYADGKPVYPNIDTLGTIFKPTGKTEIIEGIKIPVMAATPGWHVNVRCDESPALGKYVVVATTPSRIWA